MAFSMAGAGSSHLWEKHGNCDFLPVNLILAFGVETLYFGSAALGRHFNIAGEEWLD